MENNDVMENVYIGMKLYRLVQGRNSPSEIEECTVYKIGRKYFYVDGKENTPIDKDTFWFNHKVYSQLSFMLYKSIEEIEDNLEASRVYPIVQRHITCKKPTLEQLRKIASILEITL